MGEKVTIKVRAPKATVVNFLNSLKIVEERAAIEYAFRSVGILKEDDEATEKATGELAQSTPVQLEDGDFPIWVAMRYMRYLHNVNRKIGSRHSGSIVKEYTQDGVDKIHEVSLSVTLGVTESVEERTQGE